MADDTARYEAEQSALAEGAETPAFQIPVPPEVNPEVYRDVVPLVHRGFLSQASSINGVPIVWKSLNQHEFDMIRLLTSGSPKAEGNFWEMFLTYSVLALGGSNILPQRDRWFGEIRGMVRELPRDGRQAIIRALSELNRKASMATVLVEAYIMESSSRLRWLQTRGLDPSSVAVTGFPGTEQLGLCWAQLTWRALNQVEDQNNDAERDWENAKFVGACFAGKGVQKIYNQDTDRRRKEVEDRTARRDKLLRYVFEGVSITSDTTRNGQVVAMARTVEEMADQLSRDLRGEKDWHDQVVAAHEEQLRQRLRMREEQLAAIAKSAEDRFEGHNVQGGTETTGLTREQAIHRMQQSRQALAQAAARSQVRPDMDGRLEEHLQKWGYLPPEK